MAEKVSRHHATLGPRGLELSLADRTIHLAARPIGTGSDQVILFNFDPNRSDIRQAGALALASLIIDSGREPTLIITPESSKSTTMVEDLAQTLPSKPDILIIPKATDEQSFRSRIDNLARIQAYIPVTAAGQTRYLGLSDTQEQVISQHDRIIVVDDVYSTGATILGIQQLIGTNLPVFVAALELPVQDIKLEESELSYSFPDSPAGVTTGMLLPLITGDSVQQIINSLGR